MPYGCQGKKGVAIKENGASEGGKRSRSFSIEKKKEKRKRKKHRGGRKKKLKNLFQYLPLSCHSEKEKTNKKKKYKCLSTETKKGERRGEISIPTSPKRKRKVKDHGVLYYQKAKRGGRGGGRGDRRSFLSFMLNEREEKGAPRNR